jgi:hypothetical protein
MVSIFDPEQDFLLQRRAVPNQGTLYAGDYRGADGREPVRSGQFQNAQGQQFGVGREFDGGAARQRGVVEARSVMTPTGQAAPRFASTMQPDAPAQAPMRDPMLDALQPGEFRAVAPRSVMDLNRNGIPDGAEVTVSHQNPNDGTKTVAKYTVGGLRGNANEGRVMPRSVMLEPGSLVSAADTNRVMQAEAERARDNRDQLLTSSFLGQNDRNTRGGMTAGDRLLGQRNREADRASQERMNNDQFVGAAREQAGGLVGSAQATAGGVVGAEGVRQRGETARARITSGDERAKLNQAAAQFQAKMGETIQFQDDPSGQRMWRFNGQAGVVNRTPEGFFEMRGQDGKPVMILTQDGDMVTYGQDGKPVIDRAPIGRDLRSVSGATGVDWGGLLTDPVGGGARTNGTNAPWVAPWNRNGL